MASMESVNLRINKFFRHKLAKRRNNRINKKIFSIISNNCWGGMIYESYGLEKKSPTIGLFFAPSDYIKFVTKLKYYLAIDLKFIDYEKSKNKSLLKASNVGKDVPIGVLDDIEIIFLHYKNQKIAEEKWKSRIKRIDYNNIIFKFNDQNGCEEEDIESFLKLPYKNKLFFTTKNWDIKNECIIKIPQFFNKRYIYASHEPFGSNIFFNVNKYINNIESENFFELQ